MIETFFNPGIIAAAWPILLRGFGATLLLAVITVPLGCASGLLLALGSTIRHPWVRWPLVAWVDFFRAFPPLVLLIFLYAGLPFAGLRIGAYGCVALGFFLNTGAYYGEILRAGIESVPAGQIEAARSTGLSRLQALGFVGTAAGRARRAAGPAVEHGGSRETDLHRQRRGIARTVVRGAPGAERDL